MIIDVMLRAFAILPYLSKNVVAENGSVPAVTEIRIAERFVTGKSTFLAVIVI